MKMPPCPRCNCVSYILKGNICGKCGKSRRICDCCKKPMYVSFSGEWVGRKFIEVHEKCKKEWYKKQDSNCVDVE